MERLAALLLALCLGLASPAAAQFDDDPLDRSPRPERSAERRPSRRSSSDELRLNKDTLVGAAAIAIPGGAFLMWMDPQIQHPFIGTGTGILFGVVGAVFGLKAYAEGDLGLGLGIHGGGILLGFAGHHYALSLTRTRYGERRRPEPLSLAYSWRF